MRVHREVNRPLREPLKMSVSLRFIDFILYFHHVFKTCLTLKISIDAGLMCVIAWLARRRAQLASKDRCQLRISDWMIKNKIKMVSKGSFSREVCKCQFKAANCPCMHCLVIGNSFSVTQLNLHYFGGPETSEILLSTVHREYLRILSLKFGCWYIGYFYHHFFYGFNCSLINRPCSCAK